MATESNLKEARLKIATEVMSQIVANIKPFSESYQMRDDSYAHMGPEEYYAMVAVRYADALINELYYKN